MARVGLFNCTIVNEGIQEKASILIEDSIIVKIYRDNLRDVIASSPDQIIDCTGKLVFPGVIDDQVHFREPGLTHKADIYTESKAAVAGGTTSFMEMPNTNPQTTTLEDLDNKFAVAKEKSLANYSFYFGATNSNAELLPKLNKKRVCGVKVFMGSSTGNMLVDQTEALESIFKQSPILIATHCEDEATITANLKEYHSKYGDGIAFRYHPIIRSEEACFISSSLAVSLAKKFNSRLHILHLSTGKELSLFDSNTPLEQKLITAEVCVHHLWFNDEDYDTLGWKIKWNPSVKTENDRLALIEGLKHNLIDVVATDHAPHLESEKNQGYFSSPSGGPMVQHSLLAMLELAQKGHFPIELVAEKMCHAPAKLYGIEKRGFIREGYFADIVVVDPAASWKITKESLLYKCKWSPLEGNTLSAKVVQTFVNGRLVYNKGIFDESVKGQELVFSR